MLFSITLFIGCSDDETNQVEIPEVTEDIEIQDFIWQGMNIFYLWQESVPNLGDDRFDTDQEYVDYLNNAPEPDNFFESLIYNRLSVDKWSWIVDDYVELEKMFQGVSKHNGVEFGLVGISGSNDIFGYVRYILPNTSASDQAIKRGDIFTHVDGTQLDRDNYRKLLFFGSDTYTLSLAKIENNMIIPIDIDVTLTKIEYTENPVFIVKTLDDDGKKIGYLMYNSFTSNFDNELNDAFSQLKNEGITDLVLDLRYNSGGSVRSAVQLASMITGQFKGELFTKEQWNTKLQTEIENNNPDWLINNFTDQLSDGSSINSLNLNSVHIIVTGSSASASELIINGLNPYINMKLIGSKTVGKYVASITLYDSPNFTKDGVNPRHNYAMQPIVLEEVNKLGENDKDGFEPDIEIDEDFANMGVLGDEDEPLLNIAISDITGNVAKFKTSKGFPYDLIGDSKIDSKLNNNMFIDKDEVRKLFVRKPTSIDLK